jgi:RecA/RadA recombinase
MNLSQNVIVKPTLSQPVFPLNLRGVNEVFPGFALGDLAVLQGTSVSALTSLLCIKAQLPTQLGGLQSNVIFVDGGNTFGLYQIAELARIHHLKPKEVLDNIFISRAFTAYQETALIKHFLKEAIKKYNSKLVIISDIAGFFLDKDIPEDEAQRIFSQVATFLSNFARENQIIAIATYPVHVDTTRNASLHTLTCSRANVVLSFRKTSYARQFVLEKHPYLPNGVAELPLEDLTLADFAEANA